MKKNTYHVRKFNGDDCYSWAVFKNLPKGTRSGILFWEDGFRPVVSGCSKSEALSYKTQFAAKEGQT